MTRLMEYFRAFFAWWKALTGLQNKTYDMFGKQVNVNWSIVVFVWLIWVLMVLLLP
jgi:hypothetical protein